MSLLELLLRRRGEVLSKRQSPQVALLVNEPTLLPVLIPLAPAAPCR